jgi:hypothetical protein
MHDFSNTLAYETTMAVEPDPASQPPTKKIKILSYLDQSLTNKAVSKSLEITLLEYLHEIKAGCSLSTRDFWLKNEKTWPELAQYAKFLLNIPATSAPVERIFSIGGAILRPSRRKLRDEIFEKLIFLKSNLLSLA